MSFNPAHKIFKGKHSIIVNSDKTKIGKTNELSKLLIYIFTAIIFLSVFLFFGLSGNTVNLDKNLIINEVMTSNKSTIADEDGEYSDWIEIATSGKSPIDLENWGLSDNTHDPFKWKMPKVILNPGQFLLVFMSGKDRKDLSSPNLHANFKLSSKGEGIMLSDNSGQTVAQVQIPEMNPDISYGLEPSSKETWLYYDMPTPGALNSTAGSQHPIEKKAAENSDIYINEYMDSNKSTIVDEDGEFPDWIEIINSSDSPVNLKGYGLSDDKDKPYKWQFPGIKIDPNQCLLVFASGKDRKNPDSGHLHTNFKLNSVGEYLRLCNNLGQVLDVVQIKTTRSNVSYGRQIGSRNNWLYYTFSTPGAVNNTEGFSSLPPAASSASSIRISEVITYNQNIIADEEGQYPGWIELTNQGDASVDIKDYGLSDDESTPLKWRFPDIILKPGQYTLVFASGKNRYVPGKGAAHTNFKINPAGEWIVLSDSAGRIIDKMDTGKLYPGTSCGRTLNGNMERVVFKTPTPGQPNNVPTYAGFSSEPEFSCIGGFYSQPFYLSLKPCSPAVVHYTLDGSEPTENSSVWSKPILINKTTVVRAISFTPGMLPSLVTTETYFINKSNTLTVISLSTNPENLWDIDSGIYSAGRNPGTEFPYVTANYWMNWEKPVHFELFEPDGKKGLGFNGGIKIFGSYSRALDQKSFSIYARDKYGCDEINYPFFKDRPFSNYKSIILRTSGQDTLYTKIRDSMMHRLVKDTEVDVQSYRPAVVYINGEYWGVYNIREKISRFYLASNHGVDPENVDILQANGYVRYGSNTDYKALISYVTSHDMSIQQNYEYVKTKMDIENFIDYQISEIYFANTDTGNIKFWRDRSEGGKWRWILYDTDWGFFDATHNTLWFVSNPEGTGTGKMFSTALMYNLLKNNSFKDEFIERFAYHLNNTFRPERVIGIIDEMSKAIEPEMPGQFARWGGSMDSWYKKVQVLRDFAANRPKYVVNYIASQFNLSSEDIKRYGFGI